MIAHLTEMLETYRFWLVIACAGVAILAYCLGCLNGAVLVSRLFFKDDIRNYGSGNGGLTNFCRIHGGILSVLVILIDVLKAVISVLLASYIFSYISPDLVLPAKYWAGLCCILGHMFPVSFQFKGGKGVMSSGAIALMIDWRLALVIWGSFLICVILTKYVSLGSCVGALAFPIASYFLFHDPIVTVISLVMGVMVIVKHRGNIARLVKGTESKFKFKWGGKKEQAEESAEAAPEAAAAETEPAAQAEPSEDGQEDAQ